MSNFFSTCFGVMAWYGLLSSVIAQAQPSPSDSNTITLNEVVISANKIAEPSKYVAQQIHSLKADEIKRLQASTTADLLAHMGNVYVQKSQQGGGSVNIRGFEANRVLLVIDGVRLNNLIFRSGHLQNILAIDNNSLERVEVLHGSASTVYGSDAMGGVVHLLTKNPILSNTKGKTRLNSAAFTRLASVNHEHTSHLELNWAGNKWASLSMLNYSAFGDLMSGKAINPFYDRYYGERSFYANRVNGKDSMINNSNRFMQVGSEYWQADLIQKIIFKPKEGQQHKLNVQYSNTGCVPRYDRLTEISNSAPRFAEWYYGPQKRYLVSYDFILSKNENSNIHVGINYQHLQESRHNRRFDNSYLQNRLEKVNVWGMYIDCNKVMGRHNMRFGADVQFNFLQSTAFAQNINTQEKKLLDTRYPDGINQMHNIASYWSHTWNLSEKLSLTDGLRLGFVNMLSTFEDTTFFKFPFRKAQQQHLVYSANLGVVYRPNQNTKLTGLIASGFRVPNIDDLGKVFESAKGRIIVPNSNLNPEKSITSEIGLSNIWGTSTRFENVVYFTQLLDAVVVDNFKYQGSDSVEYDGSKSAVYASQNKERAYLLGFSSKFQTAIGSRLQWSIVANYTYGRVKSESIYTPMDHIPPLMTRTSLSYTYSKLSADFMINYQAWKLIEDYRLNTEDNEQYATPDGMPAWATLNLKMGYKLLQWLNIASGIDNILDTQYRTFASGINAPGRNFYGTVSLKY